ncbi:MAG: zinc ribbon domain-containing protein [Promethearchaeota archaeon]
MKRYGYYTINLSLEDAWNRTLVFFENHKCKIKDQYISTNNLYRKLRIHHGFSTHIYGTSMGETYEMIFGYNPSDNSTYVSVSVKYSNFGKGIPSKVPKDMMKKWAYEMGLLSMKLVEEIDYKFLANLDKIQEISLDQIANLSKVFCTTCGEENSKKNTFCISCGIRLDT